VLLACRGAIVARLIGNNSGKMVVILDETNDVSPRWTLCGDAARLWHNSIQSIPVTISVWGCHGACLPGALTTTRQGYRRALTPSDRWVSNTERSTGSWWVDYMRALVAHDGKTYVPIFDH
jgi:hypothetical protein